MEGQLKVLFLHGIEARTKPLKAELIASLHGVVVHCPDLGSADWMQRIWYVAGGLLLTFLGFCAALVFAVMKQKIHVWLAILLAFGTPFLLWWAGLATAQYCLRRAYDEATERARHAIAVLDPDVLVGQSFGAVVALRLEASKPLLLLSCARRYFCAWAGVPEPGWKNGYPLAVVHGTEDALCPIADATDLVRDAKGDAWLVPREGEGHMLPGLGASGLAEVLHQLGVESYLPKPEPPFPCLSAHDLAAESAPTPSAGATETTALLGPPRAAG